MSLLARASVPLRQAVLRSPSATSVRFSSTHGEYKHLPFEYNRPGVFGSKLAAYLLTGFAIPFVAAAFHLRKSG
ncbi:hypothetical protein AcW1_004244 [Taiwanofungus camphoratus]|nr:hypothetical protein AcW2_006745 [Antrodia cinnamomea]KAI0939122.1 hypothetical protein AcV5_000625 [Antrodia cinnamomea]KAI0952042.1 hypothetical protein AcV7_007967 [Antrodia cinnamomea]KAI0959418.1 hypothetical protein AcW1_004244 [Antrodia cinnamomea]